MIAPACKHDTRSKFGKDRKGQQRYKCKKCCALFVSDEQRPLGDMRIEMDKAVAILGMLLEGMSIRAVGRLLKVSPGTICDLILQVGENCDRYLGEAIKNVPVKAIQLDEIWDFLTRKNATKIKRNLTDESGDVWTWLAIDADSKLILSHVVGQRDDATCTALLTRLNTATLGRCQVTADGLGIYTNAVPYHMGSRVDFAQLVKSYSSSQTETRYSPATITGIEKKAVFGNPDMDKVSTSYIERFNLSLRMHLRRYTRLTNAHSKSFAHHSAMTAIFVCWYNFCRANSALGKGVSPAMASGVSENLWTIAKLLREVA